MAQRSGERSFYPWSNGKTGIRQAGSCSPSRIAHGFLTETFFHWNNTWEAGYSGFLTKCRHWSRKWRLFSLIMRGSMGYKEAELCNRNRGAQSSAVSLKRNRNTDWDLCLSGSKKGSCYGWLCHRCLMKGQFQVGKQHVGSSLSHAVTPAVPYNMGFPVVHSQILHSWLKWYYLDKCFSRSTCSLLHAAGNRQCYSLKAALDHKACRTPFHHFCSFSAYALLPGVWPLLPALMVSCSSKVYFTF